MNNKFQRDVFINEIFLEAKKNKDIIFISADFGAPALDKFRNELPEQFIHVGIAEQHMIDFAAGLSLSGKHVYVYAMAPFITLRCLEQIKCSLAMMDLPVTIIAVGVGLGYADAGPTHYLTEDIACMRSIVGLDVLSASDDLVTIELAKKTIEEPKLRVIRLERHALPSIYKNAIDIKDNDFGLIFSGTDVLVISYGHLLHRAKKSIEEFNENSKNKCGLIDLFSIKPISNKLIKEINKYKHIITFEEQCINGGFGSAVIEYLNDNDINIKVKRLALKEKYYFQNGGREFLLDNNNLSKKNLITAIESFNNK